MKGILVPILAFVVAAVAVEAGPKREEAVCPVCLAMQGETRAEPVKAVRAYQGKELGFCSEECARKFDSDPAGFEAPVFPRPAPTFGVTDLDGKRFGNDDLGGSVVLVDFWATWCAPCVKAMPRLQAMYERHAARGFRLIGISIDEAGPKAVKKHVESKKITYPIVLDSKESTAWEAFRVKVIPSAYLIDRSGRIVAQWTGGSPDVDEIEAEVVKLLEAKP
jgi:peroxiredoxin/YHS domain-containing protein